MDADFSVELGDDDAALEFPWQSPDGELGYADVKRDPSAIEYVTEANVYPELREFLLALNAGASGVLTAKCDVWSESQLGEAEEIYEAAVRVSSYVDLIEEADELRFDFAKHERLARSIAASLEKTSETRAAAEVIVRRCYFGEGAAGFYLTFYLSGYGDDEAGARRNWAGALRSARGAILQAYSGAESAKNA